MMTRTRLLRSSGPNLGPGPGMQPGLEPENMEEGV